MLTVSIDSIVSFLKITISCERHTETGFTRHWKVSQHRIDKWRSTCDVVVRRPSSNQLWWYTWWGRGHENSLSPCQRTCSDGEKKRRVEAGVGEKKKFPSHSFDKWSEYTVSYLHICNQMSRSVRYQRFTPKSTRFATEWILILVRKPSIKSLLSKLKTLTVVQVYWVVLNSNISQLWWSAPHLSDNERGTHHDTTFFDSNSQISVNLDADKKKLLNNKVVSDIN